MKMIQENQLKFLIRYGLLITALVEWALYHPVNAYHLLLFLVIVIVAQLDYYSIQYPWAILAQGMAILTFCYFTGNIFLKTVEGLGKFVKTSLTESFKRNPLTMVSGLIAKILSLATSTLALPIVD